jgi:hypothetical protein
MKVGEIALKVYPGDTKRDIACREAIKKGMFIGYTAGLKTGKLVEEIARKPNIKKIVAPKTKV